jgi:hypothetical protein
MTRIIPLPRTPETPPNPAFVAHLLEVTEPEMWHYGPLAGEDLEGTVARLAAASDIADELAYEFAAEAADEGGPQWPTPAPAAAIERRAA